MRRILAGLAVLAALAALLRMLRGRRPSSAFSTGTGDPRAEALRAKLAGSRGDAGGGDAGAPDEARDTAAEPAADELRRRVHAEARAAIAEMRAPDEAAPGGQSSR